MTGEPIEPGDRFVAMLIELADEGRLERRDVSLAAASENVPLGEGDRVVGAWRTVMPEPSGKPEPFLDAESLCDLVEQLGGATDGRARGLRFVLALLLARKRLARVTASDERGLALVWTKASGKATDPPEPFMVEDPGLDDSSINEVTEEFSRLLVETEEGGES